MALIHGVNARQGPCVLMFLGVWWWSGAGWDVHLHFHTVYVIVRYCAFSCTFTHATCYATVQKNITGNVLNKLGEICG